MDTLESKFRVSVDGKDELARFFSDGARGAVGMESTIKKALADTARGVQGFTLGLARDLKNISGVKLGLAENARGALEFSDSLEQLAVSAGKGDEILGGLKAQILDTASASNQFKSDVVGALHAFVEKTGDIETARKNLALYAQTATATRAAIEDVALVGVELSDKLQVKDQGRSFAVLATQAKAGAVELKDLAKYAPRIFSSGAAAGLTGEQGVRELGALSQVYAKAFGGRGSGANVATAIENTFRDISKKSTKLEAEGIKVTGRDPLDVLFDIIRKSKGDSRVLNRIFDARSTRGVNILANEFKRTGGFGTYEKFRDINADPNVIASDAARQMSTGLAHLKATQIGVERSAQENLGAPADWLARHSGVLAGSFNAITAHPVISGIAGAAGLFGLNYAKRAVLGGGGRGLLGGLAGVATGGAGIPVMVTNWPASLGGNPGLPGGAGKAAGLLGAIGKVGGALGAGYALGTLADELSGGRISGAGARGLDLLTGQSGKLSAIEGAGAERNQIALQRLAGERGDRIRQLEASGYSHGQAVFQADHPEIHLNVTIHGDEATVKEERGTRSTKAMVRRTGGN